MKDEFDIDYISDYLSQITDFSLYVETVIELKDYRNLLFLSAVRDTIGYCFTEQHMYVWKKLGFKEDLTKKHLRGYLALTDFINVTHEQLAEENNSAIFQIQIDPITQIHMFSSPWTDLNNSEIKINDEDYSDNFRGFNIVLYDLESHTVIDTASFDTHTPETRRLSRDSIHPIGKIAERLQLKNIIPITENSAQDYLNNYEKQNLSEINNPLQTEKRIEVRIVFYGFAATWNSLRSLALSYAHDKKYHVVIIACYDTDGQAKKLQSIANDGLEFIDTRDYDIYFDEADIWISNAWNDLVFDHADFRNKKGLIITLCPVLINGGMPTDEVLEQYRLLSDISDYLIVDRIVYYELEKNNFDMDKIVCEGILQFDNIYEIINSNNAIKKGDSYYSQWKKIDDKKVFLWATDHVWDTKNVTFDLYAKEIIQFFQNHTELGLIIRPHNMYPRELVYAKVWTPFDREAIRKFFSLSPNIIWDESSDIAIPFKLSDAVITDVNCGVSVSAIALNKPLAVLYRNDGNPCTPKNEEISSNLYELKSMDDLTEFFKMVASGREKENKKVSREMLFEKYIQRFDGKNYLRIKEFIEKSYYKKLKKP